MGVTPNFVSNIFTVNLLDSYKNENSSIQVSSCTESICRRAAETYDEPSEKWPEPL